MHHYKSITILVFIVFSFLITNVLHAIPPGKGYAIVNVSVIPMTRDTVLNGQTILIDDEKIKLVGASKDVAVPKGYERINGKGKFVMPGLFDMHAHFYYEQGENVNTCEEELKVMLANGLTTVRIQCGDPTYLDARQKVAEGKWIGPRLFVSSPQVVGAWPWGGKVFGAICSTPEDGSAAVKKFKAEGYDEVKITFGVKKDVFEEINKAARENGIGVTGHVGPLTKLPTALKWREQNEHMDEFIDMLLPDTTYNHGESVSDMNVWRKRAWETVPYLDEGKIPALVEAVRESGIYVTPTNYFFLSFFGRTIDEAVATKREGWKYVPSILKEEAGKVRAQYMKSLPAESSRMKYIHLRKKMTNELWKSGVPLMAGSDSPQWYSATGFTIHDELSTFVECGLPPFAALQTATINPATYLHINDETGTVEAGKNADLILLNSNPLNDINNTRDIRAIFIRGKYIDEKGRSRLLHDALVLGK